MSVDARDRKTADPATLDVWTDPDKERLLTPATVITFIRTAASVVVSGFAIHDESLTLLVVALAVYWVGDTLDGFVARVGKCETRIGAVLDIMSDRFCAAGFYLGLAWLHHEYTIPVLIYLAEFMVIDNFLSIAFLAWRIRSPNYFFVIDYKIWLYSWSKPGKAVNSAIFAVILLLTKMPWLGIVIASALMLYKLYALARLLRIGLPIPPYDGPPHRAHGQNATA
ncbi:MAG: CDP-alcohol phosphatidyltransferase family protein [Marmoricola sp.]